MATVNLHTGILTSPKHAPLSDGALRLWLNGLCWSKEHLTDGFIPTVALPILHPKATRFVSELLAVVVPGKGPLWHDAPGGYRIHDYDDWQETKERIQERRQQWRSRKDKQRDTTVNHASVTRDTTVNHAESPSDVSGGGGGVGSGGGGGAVTQAREPDPATVIAFDDRHGASPAKRIKAHIAWKARRDILDIPHDLFGELLSAMPTPDEPALRLWLAATEEAWTHKGVASTFKFWRARAEEQWGGTSAKAAPYDPWSDPNYGLPATLRKGAS